MRRETRVQIAAGVMMVVCLVASGVVATELSASVGRNKLGYATRAVDGDPPQVALGIAMGAFRGMFVNWLWMRAESLKEDGKYHEAINLAKAITTLQPRFPKVWQFQAWNMAYNISVKTQTPEERWEWVHKGIRLLREQGVVHNPNSLDLHRELAWIFLHKIGGTTDDANQYYKRRMAYEWSYLMGPPPGPDPEARTREQVTERFATWLDDIAAAPATIEELLERDPRAGELLEKLRTLADEEPNERLLEHYQMHVEVGRSGLKTLIREDMGGRSLALLELIEDPAFAEVWPTLISTIRQRVLADEYNMDIRQMARFTRRFGPLDWRHPAAHSVYWAAQGVENAEQRVNAENEKDYDFVNSDRIVVQALQELYRSGELYYDMLGFRLFGAEEQSLYLAMPNVHFLESYGELIEDAIPRAGIYEDSSKRYYTLFSAGYENFLNDAIRFLWRRGQEAEAREWYEKLRTWYRLNRNDDMKAYTQSLPIEDFVARQYYDERFKTPYVAASEVFGALQGAYVGLLRSDDELFRSQLRYASEFHRRYMEAQRNVVLAGGDTARMAVMPEDFQLMAGAQFGVFIQLLDLDSAALVYGNAPESLRRSAFDVVVPRFKAVLDEQAEEGRSFEEMFPEPSGMDAFRVDMQRRMESRQRELEVESK